MTVNELIAELQRMVAEGHGEAEVWASHGTPEGAWYNERTGSVDI